ncbi:response regulator [Phytomonospora endophytica]|uniref:DNA-binding NarL/FixJ family response regulator n=1 Tax=Phytomonospora endophytica TaxID=714109 RepID=A0A841G1B9_9ACTN|nr:response regulator transcription factor [Phytomonospora endophytica]MBB6038469.1 DNA-binding NarL/FixJ family response regulator [Phytomonospora endophytica]GIG64398.1 DNA-binding response regulator [Phytomonospora endophytica]
MSISVLLTDDQPLIRAGFAALLNSDPDIDVVGEAADGAEAVALAERLRPDVILMDVQMPEMNGIEATRRITAMGLDSRVVILTNYALDVYVFEGLRAGACGFLVKDTLPTELLRSIRVAVEGHALLSPEVTTTLIEEYVSRPPTPVAAPALDALTAREREVLLLVASGLSNEEIARRLVISHTTAKTHVSRTMLKLGARDRAQLVMFAYENGVVVPRSK